MFDRSGFWSPPPDWRQATHAEERLQITAVVLHAAWRLSGSSRHVVLTEIGVRQILGPRDVCDAARYALRLTPDSVLLIGDAADSATLRQSSDRPERVMSELSAGFIGIDITGAAAPSLMQLASEYPFMDKTYRPEESARMGFAGLPVVMMRRSGGWRLHIERPWAAALWRWLVEHGKQVGKDGLQ